MPDEILTHGLLPLASSVNERKKPAHTVAESARTIRGRCEDAVIVV
jgi:hypothetical protein